MVKISTVLTATTESSRSSPHAHAASPESSAAAHAEALVATPARDLDAQPAAVHVVPIPGLPLNGRKKYKSRNENHTQNGKVVIL